MEILKDIESSVKRVYNEENEVARLKGRVINMKKNKPFESDSSDSDDEAADVEAKKAKKVKK